ncbi:conserved Plasmodium protein, unknown function [Plasmodium gallinaceum]|uniref:AP-5 complex subunit sigma-1 n=1 Tax=Plasmodium gallinaceum TaxID=5849 RepID=A0A1J1GPB4_PLAGA|nr:conserved Plasmodium protein, unknown function [Plasmodium gallinaceum]CRG94140.1 conserved Plasmodium protein, unknown function [Plasmodium gallinaceum]
MVYGIIIHSSENETDFHFSYYYNGENEDEYKYIRQQSIIKRVIEENKYYEEDKGKSENISKRNTEKYLELFNIFLSKNANNEIKMDNEGIFRIVNPSLFKNKVNIMWKVLNKICYTLIFFTHENILLADYFLYNFIFVLREYYDKLKKFRKPDMNIFNPDEILAILYYFLPRGQLMLISFNQTKILYNKVKEFLENKAELPPKKRIT